MLVQLVEAPAHRLRMTELAEAVLLSRSGVTRLVDRLERAAWSSRCPVETTGAAWRRRSPRPGRAAAGASRTHLAGVVRHFAEPSTPTTSPR